MNEKFRPSILIILDIFTMAQQRRLPKASSLWRIYDHPQIHHTQ